MIHFGHDMKCTIHIVIYYIWYGYNMIHFTRPPHWERWDGERQPGTLFTTTTPMNDIKNCVIFYVANGKCKFVYSLQIIFYLLLCALYHMILLWKYIAWYVLSCKMYWCIPIVLNHHTLNVGRGGEWRGERERAVERWAGRGESREERSRQHRPPE